MMSCCLKAEELMCELSAIRMSFTFAGWRPNQYVVSMGVHEWSIELEDMVCFPVA